jgi:hypothetical protein
MTKAEVIALQQDLIKLGYLPPMDARGRPSDDGIYGPKTKAAYQKYWRNTTLPRYTDSSRSIGIAVPVVVPEPVAPWWTSRGIWGSLLTLAAVGAGFAGHGFDAQEATDAIMPIVELIPLVMGAIGGLLAWWGRTQAKAPIDPTLVARVGTHDLRLPTRLHDKPVPPRSSAGYKDPRGHFGE